MNSVEDVPRPGSAGNPRSYPFDQPDRLGVHPSYAELRRDDPVSRVQLAYGEPAWLATRYADVKFVLSDPRFSRALAFDRDEPSTRPKGAIGRHIRSLQYLDPPEHTRIRKILSHAFTVRGIEKLRPGVQRLADELVDGMLERGRTADLAEDFARPFPAGVICELLGVPYADRHDFQTWSDAFMSVGRLSPEQIRSYATQLREYMGRLIVQRREAPKDDLMSILVTARDVDGRLNDDELLSLAVAILVGGHETTASQISSFTYALLARPELPARLVADPELVAPTVEELLRYVPLFSMAAFPRYATEDVEVGGVLVRAGEPVLVSLVSANRDESVYHDPDVLDVTRKESAHVGFGYGAHFCVGAQLARVELQIALRTLLRRLPGLRFATSEQDVEWKRGLFTRGPLRLPIAWDGA
ncbi:MULTISPECIES: cytochrome P450 [unclassified Saccharopolyspora]|uniref:cytochrome P450 n=1 Tax=unclassified Saccharopolyspora TaxID=2646250 RepID=UPI001CD41AA7|nr:MULTISPECIES: cytochrome P450 [unclassified Saccharopolyspora]MCA1185030.1 cytochrome P450 [Saccharopolyspora sp. 6T]MCA1190752.1 cytochrome P450 [Saccharopolyspora sp. 6V]MCA1226249.1 cytochrome P450 [Saccharopolyspora sp. 6M]MCA1278216.1 cytochrome P450 [Saccharopolyspora sp. 7B]